MQGVSSSSRLFEALMSDGSAIDGHSSQRTGLINQAFYRRCIGAERCLDCTVMVSRVVDGKLFFVDASAMKSDGEGQNNCSLFGWTPLSAGWTAVGPRNYLEEASVLRGVACDLVASKVVHVSLDEVRTIRSAKARIEPSKIRAEGKFVCSCGSMAAKSLTIALVFC